MCHRVCSVALPVHWHLSGDAASSDDGIFDTHLAACATVSVQLFYVFTGTCLDMLQAQVMTMFNTHSAVCLTMSDQALYLFMDTGSEIVQADVMTCSVHI